MADGNTEETFTFYRSVFGGEFVLVVRFGDFGQAAMGASPSEREKIAHMALPIGQSTILMGSDVLQSHGQSLAMGNNFYISLEAGRAAILPGRRDQPVWLRR